MPSSTDLGHGPCEIKWKEMFKSMSKIILKLLKSCFFLHWAKKRCLQGSHKHDKIGRFTCQT